MNLLTRTFFDKPLLIAGTGRSGTSVLKEALGQHPQILACDGESPLVATAAALARPFEIGSAVDYQIRALKVPLDYLYAQVRTICFEAAAGPHLGARRVMRDVMRKKKWPFKIKYWCAKTFCDATQADCLARLYPSVKFLYIFRNGCEVVRSRSRFGSMRHMTFREHCLAWEDEVRKYDYLRYLKNSVSIRHEDLLGNPAGVLSALWHFLAVSQDPRPEHVIAHTLVHPLDEPTQRDIDTRRAFRDREPPHAGWSESERATFRDICEESMLSLGYEMPF